MRPACTCWNFCWRWLLHQERGTSLALFRIGVGLTCLATFTSIIVTGQVEAMWLDPEYGGYRSQRQPPPYLFDWLGGLTPTTLWSMIALLLASALTFTAGCCSRLSAFVLLQTHQAVTGINGHTTGCDDQLIHNALWLLIFAGSSATLSLSCRLRTGRWTSAELVSAWPRYLAIFQIVVVYFTTGLQKTGPAWQLDDCSALYLILQHPSWQRWDLSWLAWVYPLVQAASAVTIVWELSAPLLIVALVCQYVPNPIAPLRWINRLDFRRWFVFVGVGIHLGIWLLMGLGNFTWISCTYYFCLYAPEEWTQAAEKAPVPSAPSPRFRLVSGLVALFFVWHVAAICYGSYPLTDAERKAMWAPLKDYYEYCGTEQGWPMFSSASPYARRLYVDVCENGQWRTVFGQSSSTYTWRSYQLNAEHLRAGFYFSIRRSWHFEELARWFATRAAADFPGAERVRLRVHWFTILTPEEVRAGHTEPYDVQETIIADVELGSYRSS